VVRVDLPNLHPIEKDITPREVIIGSISAMLIFFVSFYLLHHHWTVTSIVVITYSVNIRRVILFVLSKLSVIRNIK
jgi:hypothetical protein